MIAVPQVADQFSNATRLAELGVGVHLPSRQLTARMLREAVEKLTGDPEVRNRLAALQAEIRTTGGVTRAADAVEDFLPAPGRRTSTSSGRVAA